MPTSDRHRAGRRKKAPALVLLAAGAALSACQMTVTGATGNAKVLDSAMLDAGTITLRGPAGYCIDAKSLRASGPRQFALLAQCDILKSGAIEGVKSLSFITVTAVRSADGAPLPTAQQLADTFGPARILDDSTRNGVRLVHLSDGGQRAGKNADPAHWRGVMQTAGHTLGLAAYSTAGGAATGRGGRDLLMALVNNTRRATSGGTGGDSLGVQKPGG